MVVKSDEPIPGYKKICVIIGQVARVAFAQSSDYPARIKIIKNKKKKKKK